MRVTGDDDDERAQEHEKKNESHVVLRSAVGVRPAGTVAMDDDGPARSAVGISARALVRCQARDTAIRIDLRSVASENCERVENREEQSKSHGFPPVWTNRLPPHPAHPALPIRHARGTQKTP